MLKELESVKFTLTPNMSLELIKFNKLKKDLLEYKKLYNLDKDDKLLIQINELEKDLLKIKDNFIREFRLSNKSEIKEYLDIKNHN